MGCGLKMMKFLGWGLKGFRRYVLWYVVKFCIY